MSQFDIQPTYCNTPCMEVQLDTTFIYHISPPKYVNDMGIRPTDVTCGYMKLIEFKILSPTAY